MRGIAVAAQLPEAEPVVRQHLDATDPLRPLPGVELWSDDADRTAVLDGKRLTLRGVHEEDVVLEGLFQWEIGRVTVVLVSHVLGRVRSRSCVCEIGRELDDHTGNIGLLTVGATW